MNVDSSTNLATTMKTNLLQALQQDGNACELLIILQYIAAHSSHQSLTLNPIPGGNKYLQPNLDADVDQIRQVLASIRPFQSAEAFVNQLGEEEEILHTALFGYPNTSTSPTTPETNLQQQNATLVMRSTNEHTLFSRRDRTNRINRVFRTVSRQPATHGAGAHSSGSTGITRAFHGSAVENWYSILHNGLKILPQSYGAQSGRVYGNGVYLARHFEVAASFAPHTSVAWSGTSIQSLSIVGEFHVTQDDHNDNNSADGCQPTSTLPDGYIVVFDASRVKLVGLHVLASTSTHHAKRSTLHVLSQLNMLYVFAVLYMLWLVWIGWSR